MKARKKLIRTNSAFAAHLFRSPGSSFGSTVSSSIGAAEEEDDEEDDDAHNIEKQRRASEAASRRIVINHSGSGGGDGKESDDDDADDGNGTGDGNGAEEGDASSEANDLPHLCTVMAEMAGCSSRSATQLPGSPVSTPHGQPTSSLPPPPPLRTQQLASPLSPRGSVTVERAASPLKAVAFGVAVLYHRLRLGCYKLCNASLDSKHNKDDGSAFELALGVAIIVNVATMGARTFTAADEYILVEDAAAIEAHEA